jgi:peptidoglycan-associated lipoprotein
MLSKKRIAAVLISFMLLSFAAGCKKKAPAPPAPPPPKPVEQAPAPAKKASISQFTAEPSSIERGQSATLRWSVSDATEVRIEPGLGAVQSNGSRSVFPSSTTQYTLTAKGAGGDDSRSVTVNVSAPPAPAPPPPPTPTKNFGQELSNRVQDAYFDYDKSDVRADARDALTRNADAIKAILRDFPSNAILIEGHCDERGSAEYNLGLGDRRSNAAKDFLVQLGIPGDRLKVISYGKERPQCTEADEGCYQKNRRAHFAPGQ